MDFFLFFWGAFVALPLVMGNGMMVGKGKKKVFSGNLFLSLYFIVFGYVRSC